MQEVQARFEQLRQQLQRETDETRQRLNRSADERAAGEKAKFIAIVASRDGRFERAIEAVSGKRTARSDSRRHSQYRRVFNLR